MMQDCLFGDIKKEWKSFVHQDFEWVVNHFSEQKNIQIIGTPKSIGQAKIVGTLIEKIQTTQS